MEMIKALLMGQLKQIVFRNGSKKAGKSGTKSNTYAND